MQPTGVRCGHGEQASVRRSAGAARYDARGCVTGESVVHVRNPANRTAADHHRSTVLTALKRVVDTLAVNLRPKPDLSLVNEKFSDSFERERTERLLHNRW
jgi:hypothetical protein